MVHYLPSLIALRLLGVFGRGLFDRDAWTLRTVSIDCLDYYRRGESLWLAPPPLARKDVDVGTREEGGPRMDHLCKKRKLQLQEVVVRDPCERERS